MKKRGKKFTTIVLILLAVYILSSLAINAATPTGPRLKNVQSRVLIGTEFPSGFSTLSDSATFTSVAAAEFNIVTPENCMKWDAIESTRNYFNYTEGDKLVSWGQSNGFKLHGHTLIWHSQNPSWVSGLGASDMLAAMYNHIDKVMAHYKGKILVWDVVNEAFNEDGTYRGSLWYNNLGKSYIENAFTRARAADGSAKLIYNDYNLEATGAKSNGVYNMLKDLKSRGIAVDGIGFQMHLDIQYGFDFNDFARNMQRFADLGLEIYITEMDVRLSSNPSSAELQTQADYYKGVIQICMAQPAVKAIQIWGFTDKYSWVPSVFPGRDAALIFDSNYNPKPSYYAVQSGLGYTVTITPTRPMTPPPTFRPTPTPSVTTTQAPTTTPTPTRGTRSAFSQIEAESYNTQSGVQTESCGEGGQDVGYIQNGDYVVYNSIDFGSGATGFQARVASATSGGKIEIRLDSTSGSLVGTCTVSGTGGWQTWTTKTCTVSGASGTHNLYLRFTGSGTGYLMNFNWFKFTGGTPTPSVTTTPTPTPTPSPTPSPTATPTPTPTTNGVTVYVGIQNTGEEPSNSCIIDLSPASLEGTARIIGGYPSSTLKTYPVTYLPNTQVTFTASTVDRTVFRSWTVGGTQTSSKSVTVIVQGGEQIIATFWANFPTPFRRITVTPTPTPTPTPTQPGTPTPTGNGEIGISYVISDWGGAANVDVVIKNNSSTPVNGWTLAWTFPGNQTITNMWNASYTQSGASVSAKNLYYNATIAANGGSVSFGFSITYTGTNAKPTVFTLNGVPFNMP